MESPDFSPPHVDVSRPSLGFPLGTALLLIIIFSLSGIFSCCYHWDKLRSLRRSYADDLDLEHGPTKPISAQKESKLNQSYSLPVLMPGDKVPMFIALPCPCEPPRDGKFSVGVVTGGGDPAKPPMKPPRMVVPLC